MVFSCGSPSQLIHCPTNYCLINLYFYIVNTLKMDCLSSLYSWNLIECFHISKNGFLNKWMILLSLKFDCQHLIICFLIFLFLFIFYYPNYNGLNTSLFCTWVFNAVKINDVLRYHTGYQQCLGLSPFLAPALDIHTEVVHCGFSSWQYAQLKDSSLNRYRQQNYSIHDLF